MILDVKQLNKIVKLSYFDALKALWDGQGKIKMYYGLKRSYRDQGFQNFKPCHFLTIKYVWKSKEIVKLLLNIRSILSSIKIPLFQKQQIVKLIC